MIRRPPRSTRTDTLFPYTTLFRSHQRGTIFNVVTWLVHQKEMTARLMNRAGASRMIGIGFRRWKQANLAPMLALNPKRLIFVPDAQAASRLELAPGDNLARTEERRVGKECVRACRYRWSR